VTKWKNAGFALIQLGICPVSWDAETGTIYPTPPIPIFGVPVPVYLV
jgi:hypothetical protein